MITENLNTLNIHKLTQEQYNRELLAGNIDENALYFTTDDNQEQLEDISETLNAIQEELDGKASKATTLSGYGITDAYTKAQVDSALDGKAASGHNHDDRYYTESEMDIKLSGKADASHNHDAANISLTINDPTTILVNEDNIYDALITLDDAVSNNDGNIDTVSEKVNNINTALSSHTTNQKNPHGVTAAQVGAYSKEEVDSAISSAKSYADTKIADLVNSAPETLDTLGELAAAFETNEDVVNALNDAITNKADKSDIVQANWNQNDETALDYVKNRPFYISTYTEWESGIDPTADYDNQMLSEEVTITRPSINYYEVAYPANTVEPGFCNRLRGAYIVYDNGGKEGSHLIEDSDFDENGNLNLTTVGYVPAIHIDNETGAVVLRPTGYYNDSKLMGHSVLRIEWQDAIALDEKFIPNTIARVSDIPEQAQPDWKETDETSPAYIKNKPTEEDALMLLCEVGIIEPTVDSDGAILTDENGCVLSC